MAEWAVISLSFPGWTLTEIKEMSRRERTNWLEVAKEYGKVVRRKSGE
jgi:hypothetical protein